MTPPQPRVIVPGNVVKGEVFPVKTIISHEMETGLRFDDNGVVIPRKIINRFVCTYAGTVVFSVDLHEAVSANPFFEFFLVATETSPSANATSIVAMSSVRRLKRQLSQGA